MSTNDISKKYPISSKSTLFFKYVFPLFWFSILFIAILISIFSPENIKFEKGLWGIWSDKSKLIYVIVIFSIGSLFLIYHSVKLKMVYITEDGIILSNGHKVWSYKNEDISHITTSLLSHNYVIKFKNNNKIYFIPPIFDGPLYKDPFFQKLMKKVTVF